MTNSNNDKTPIQLNLASAKDINFLTEKTLLLHGFESRDDEVGLTTGDDFEEQVRSWLSLELEAPSSLLFMVETDAVKTKTIPIGFAFIKILDSQNNFTTHKSFGLLQSLWIEPEFQNRSYGRQTVDFIEAIFKEQNIPYYEVNYSATNIKAENFWNNCGLTPCAVTARKFLS